MIERWAIKTERRSGKIMYCIFPDLYSKEMVIGVAIESELEAENVVRVRLEEVKE